MNNLYNPSKIFSSNALIGSMEKYLVMYKHSLESPDKFWAEEAEKLFGLKSGIQFVILITMFVREIFLLNGLAGGRLI